MPISPVDLWQAEFDLPDAVNLHEYIKEYNSDEGFEPANQCQPTECPAGGMEKAEIIRQRLMRCEELWHDDDPKVESPQTAYGRLVECFE